MEAELTLRSRVIYTRTKVQNDVKRILTIYRRSGRYAAKVEPKIIQLPQNRVNLIFEINEFALYVDKLLSILDEKENDIDAVALVPGPNFKHITGGQFFLMERPFLIIISKFHKPLAIVPVLEVSNFTKLNFDADIIEWQDLHFLNNFLPSATLPERLSATHP